MRIMYSGPESRQGISLLVSHRIALAHQTHKRALSFYVGCFTDPRLVFGTIPGSTLDKYRTVNASKTNNNKDSLSSPRERTCSDRQERNWRVDWHRPGERGPRAWYVSQARGGQQVVSALGASKSPSSWLGNMGKMRAFEIGKPSSRGWVNTKTNRYPT